MSLTITSQPTANLLSAGNNNFYCVSGTTVSVSGVTEYKYKADLFIGGEYSTTLTAFPEPGTNFGVFNLLNILNNYVTYDFPVSGSTTITTSVFNQCPNSFNVAQLSFYEEYVTGTTFVTSAYGPSSSELTFINSSFSYKDSLLFNLSNYVLGTSTRKFLLTNQDATSYLFPAYSDMHSWLHYFQDGEADLQIFTYDASKTFIRSQIISNPFPSYVGVVNVATGMPELSASIDFTGAAYYTITMVNGGSAVSQTIWYQVLQNCGRFAPTSYKIYWLGAFGEINSWYFTKKAVITSNKTQSTYKKMLGKANASGQVVQRTYDHQVTPFYTSVNDEIVLSTDFLSDQDVLFLKGLYQSPIVYMQDQSGIIQAITIDQDSYVINKRVNKRPYSLQLTVQTSVNDYTQLI